MEDDEKFAEKLHSHEDYSLMEEMKSNLREANKSGDWDKADELTGNLSAITKHILRQVGYQSPLVNDPLYDSLDEAFSELRKAQRNNDQPTQNILWNKINIINVKIDQKYNSSNKN